MVCVFKHLYCSAQLSMSNMEKRYRNKIIIIIINDIIMALSSPPAPPTSQFTLPKTAEA